MLLPEWSRQSMVLLSWPDPQGDWAPVLAAVETEYCALAAAIAARQPLVIACRDAARVAHVEARLAAHGGTAGRVRPRYVVQPYDDTWVRDYGPLAVRRAHGVTLVAFRFNAWGGKYPHARDAAFADALHAAGLWGDVPLHRDPLVAEGGALETDGEGLLLTTGGCLDAPSRNPGLERGAIERRLRARLGVRRVAWLDVPPLAGDDTDGHVDTLARCCPGGVIVHATCRDPGDPHTAPLAALREQLAALRDARGRPFRLAALPLPEPLHSSVDGRRLAASYANFLVINGAVLCPQFGSSADRGARATLARCFPDREVIGIPSRTLLEQNGSVHCATLQLPAGVPLRDGSLVQGRDGE